MRGGGDGAEKGRECKGSVPGQDCCFCSLSGVREVLRKKGERLGRSDNPRVEWLLLPRLVHQAAEKPQITQKNGRKAPTVAQRGRGASQTRGQQVWEAVICTAPPGDAALSRGDVEGPLG